MITVGNSVCLLVAVDDSLTLMLSIADKVTTLHAGKMMYAV
jgi:ABC-type uncharacterized transport system ATPase subunit